MDYFYLLSHSLEFPFQMFGNLLDSPNSFKIKIKININLHRRLTYFWRVEELEDIPTTSKSDNVSAIYCCHRYQLFKECANNRPLVFVTNHNEMWFFYF